MNKKSLLALLLVLCVMLSGCSLVTMDPEVDAATPIVTIGDKVYTKAEIKLYTENYLAQVAQQYLQQYGYSIDTTSASAISAAQDEVIHELIEMNVIEQKIAEYGVGELSDEEKTALEEQYNEYHDLFVSWFPEDMDEAERESYIAQYMYMYTGVSSLEDMTDAAIQAKLRGEVVKDVEVTEDEVKAAYDAAVANAQSTYLSSPTSYGSSVNNGNTVYYRPAGYRMVKNLLIKMDEEAQSYIASVKAKGNAQRTTAANLLTSINEYEGVDLDALLAQVNVTVTNTAATVEEAAAEPVEAPAEEAAAETEDAVEEPAAEPALVVPAVPVLEAEATDTFEATEDEAQLALNTLVRDYASAIALAEQYEALLAEFSDAAFATLDARADEALAKLADGAAWDDVMAEYTDDPGMQGDTDTAKTGYAVCANFTGFDSAFVEAAMSVENVGEYSDKTRGNYGYYIVQYASEVAEGPVDLEEVRDDVTATALSDKQDAFYHETVEAWVSNSGAIIDKKPLSY